jgi:hypothetical protein
VSLRVSRRSLLGTAAGGLVAVAGCLGGPDAPYDPDALEAVRDRPSPRLAPAALPYPNGYVAGVRELVADRLDAAASRLDSLPAGVDPDGPLVSAARRDLEQARRDYADSRAVTQTAAATELRYARFSVGRAHAFLDAATVGLDAAAVREKGAELRPLVDATAADVEYRALDVPPAVVVPAATESRVVEARGALGVAAAHLDDVPSAAETERARLLARANGAFVKVRAALADANAVIRGQRAAVFDGTESYRPALVAAGRSFAADLREVERSLPSPPDAGVTDLERLSWRRLSDVVDVSAVDSHLEAGHPALAVDAAGTSLHHAAAHRSLSAELRDGDHRAVGSATRVDGAKRAAADAVEEARRDVSNGVEQERLRPAGFALQAGDRYLDEAVESDRVPAGVVERASVEYVAARHLATTAVPVGERVVGRVRTAAN